MISTPSNDESLGIYIVETITPSSPPIRLEVLEIRDIGTAVSDYCRDDLEHAAYPVVSIETATVSYWVWRRKDHSQPQEPRGVEEAERDGWTFQRRFVTRSATYIDRFGQLRNQTDSDSDVLAQEIVASGINGENDELRFSKLAERLKDKVIMRLRSQHAGDVL